MQRDYDYEFKICLVGEMNVGKTCLIQRYADDMFEENTLNTLGVDFRFKSVNYKESFVKLQIWDTAGQQTFRSIISSYYQNADAVVVVYDVLDFQSFQKIDEYWLEEVRSKSRVKKDCLIYLFANKCDNGGHIGNEQKEWCNKNQIMCFQVSAKTGEGVFGAFQEIVELLIQVKPKLEKPKVTMTLDERSVQPKKGCCK